MPKSRYAYFWQVGDRLLSVMKTIMLHDGQFRKWRSVIVPRTNMRQCMAPYPNKEDTSLQLLVTSGRYRLPSLLPSLPTVYVINAPMLSPRDDLLVRINEMINWIIRLESELARAHDRYTELTNAMGMLAEDRPAT